MIKLSNELTSDLVSNIARTLIMRYKIEREKTRRNLEEKYNKRVIFAHELFTCPEKLKFREKMSELELLTSFIPSVILGEIVEQGVKEYLEKIGFKKFNGFCIKEYKDFVIAGSPDYISDNRKIIIDVKFSRRGILREHHYLRVRLYLTICDSEKGYILYIGPRRIVTIEVSNPLSNDEVESRILSGERFSWECKYCIFNKYCRIRGE